MDYIEKSFFWIMSHGKKSIQKLIELLLLLQIIKTFVPIFSLCYNSNNNIKKVDYIGYYMNSIGSNNIFYYPA